ncbi:MAG TPA: CHAD domain-containing protein [Burkholderiales bacterium]|nr:CHAD domain-containing protein [Burkholderiales bacterium]
MSARRLHRDGVEASTTALSGEDTSASQRPRPPSPIRTPPVQPQVEVELKLSIAPEDVAKLARLPLVRASARGRAHTRVMHSIYYDTPDCDLRRSGIALRLRREGSRWMQTLKGGGAVEGGLHRRDEIELPIAGPFIDLTPLDASLTSVLPEADGQARLRPVFTADFRRTVRRVVPTSGVELELCVDTGQIVAGESSEPISEVELELKSGPAHALIAFADALVGELPLRLEPMSKAERGYRLANAARPAPTKAPEVRLDPAMSVTSAWRTLVFACIAHLQANEAGTIAGEDSEYLHQARVALRRLRSAFNVFSGPFPRASMQELLGEIRWLDDALGPARDWDVFTLSTLPQIETAFPDHAGLQALGDRAQQLRAASLQTVRESLRSTRYTRLLLQLIGLFDRQPWLLADDANAASLREASLLGFVADVLARRHRKVIKRGRRLEALDLVGLHELRIAVKKLRYAAEFFATLFERKAQRRYVRALAALQEHLGALNDAATIETLCSQLGSASADQGEAIGLLRGWSAAGARAQIEQLKPAWKRFRDADPFW